MAKNNNLKDFLVDVANAIRSKKGTSASINPQNFSSEIRALGSPTVPTEEITITPTTQGKTITPTAGKYISKATVLPVTNSIDKNIVASNIKSNVTILGVTGTFKGGITPTGTLNITTNGTHNVTNYASANVSVSTNLSIESALTGNELIRYLDKNYGDEAIGTIIEVN